MNNYLAIFLVVQACVFLVWGVIAFRWLFALRADAVALSGRTLPKMATQLKAFRGGLVEPRYRRYRFGLLVTTFVLLAMSALAALLIN